MIRCLYAKALYTIGLMTMVCLDELVASQDCQNLLPNQTTFDVHFWNFFPYTTTNTTNPLGVFNLIAKNLTTNSKLNINWGQQSSYKEILQMTNNGLTNQAIIPILIETEDTDPCRVKLFESTGFAYVVRRNVKKPLNQLAGSFINGGQVIGLTLILTGIAGICMWLLDRNRNPDNFPATFVQGSWQGFWWAFVTMTTVGYGDLAPKSVQARMFSVLWMLLGLVAFSVLTANFTSSLAREIETDLNLFNKKMAVFKGSIERKAAIDVGGKYKEYTTLSSEMINALKGKVVEGLLIDKHAAVSSHDIIENDDTIEIGKMVDYNHFVGMKLLMPEADMCIAVKQCVERQMKTTAFQETVLEAMSRSTISKDEVEQAGSLFEDYEFFVILIVLFAVMTGFGVLWEYFWYRPNMLKRAKSKSDDIEVTDRNTLKHILTDAEVNNLCESCCGTVEAIYLKDGQIRQERLQDVGSDAPLIKLNDLIPFKRNRDKVDTEKA